MRSGRVVTLSIIACAALVGLPQASARLAAQTTPPASAGKAEAAWTPLKTAWGHPDLQGIWDSTTGTPLERPADLAGKEFLTDAEAEEREKKRFAQFDSADRGPGNPTGDYGSVWREGSKNALNRTSLIVDPKNGKLPPLTADGQRIATARRDARRTRGAADSWEDRSLWERCLTRGTPRIPNNYNSNWHILQTPDYVVIHQEMIHETRVIPLDGRPHLGAGLRQWNGDARGRWEGDTLVVETTNFNDLQEFRGFPLTRARLIERFRRTGADTVDYQFTIDDRATYTAPFTVSLPMTRNGEGYFEYACHEGNYGLTNILSGERAMEKAAPAKRPSGAGAR
jgi:hypothetical protein